IPDNATILSATLNLYFDYVFIGFPGGLSARAEYYSAWPIDEADYSFMAGNNAHAGTPLSSLARGAYHNFALQNLGNISRTGYTGFRLSVSPPAHYYYDGSDGYSYRPYEHWAPMLPQLVVTYAVN
ncbi:MAG: hypothetical protein HY536_02270, partial [Candidatus Colwellbacteria bacterium]|nr:hypothetical protein [Candidatus Colwellbacteria bacterium]